MNSVLRVYGTSTQSKKSEKLSKVNLRKSKGNLDRNKE